MIFTSPPVPLPTSSAKRSAFYVWKFPTGHTVARSRLTAADAERTDAALVSTAPVPTITSRRVNMIVLLLTFSASFEALRYSTAFTGV
jgi:hypothetical protein